MTIPPVDPKALAALSKPLEKLIDVVSRSIGAAANPILLKRDALANAEAIKIKAQAEADAMVIKAKGVADALSVFSPYLLPAQLRAIHELTREQNNLEKIIEVAVENLPETASPEVISDTWLNHFFDSAKKVSQAEMQTVWGKILANQIADTGAFSLRSLDTLKNITHEEALIFQKLSRLIFENSYLVLINGASQKLNRYGITYDELMTLEDAGLLLHKVNTTITILPKTKTDSECSYEILTNGGVIRGTTKRRELSFFVYPLTRAGSELLSLIEPDPFDSYFQEVLASLSIQGDNWVYLRMV